MNNYENPYIRLQTYYSWISRGSYDLDGMSILELHHYTPIPIDTIRQDIAAMLKWQEAIDSKYDGNISFIPVIMDGTIAVLYLKKGCFCNWRRFVRCNILPYGIQCQRFIVT